MTAEQIHLESPTASDEVVDTRTSHRTRSAPHILGTAGGFDLIDYSAMVERMVVEFPGTDRQQIEAIAMREHDAMIGGMLLAVPDVLEDGVREQLAPVDAEMGATAA